MSSERYPGQVVLHLGSGEGGHEIVTHRALGGRLARLLGLRTIDIAGPADLQAYHVPRTTLVGPNEAERLGIRHTGHLFGGWVPHEWMATKAITHPLVDADAARPEGWTDAFARNAGDITLDGFSTFSAGDARRAGEILLARGPVRIKPIHADGARGQSVVRSLEELDATLSQIAEEDQLRDALVLEENLDDVQTFSVGAVEFGDAAISYCGTQSLTTDNGGASVYGGSDLIVARGGYETLARCALSEDMRSAVACARRFDQLAGEHLPTFIASRRNYDVVSGVDPRDRQRVAVLEQSWRIGGASAAEILALERFAAQPELTTLRARTVERYGASLVPPSGAVAHYQGDDPAVGALLKYAMTDEMTDAGKENRL